MATDAVGDADTWGDWLKALVVFGMLATTGGVALVATGCGPMPEVRAGQTSEQPGTPGKFHKPDDKLVEEPREMIRVREPENPKASKAAEKAPESRELEIPATPRLPEVAKPPTAEGAEHRPEVILTEVTLARVAELTTAFRWEIAHVKAELIKGTTLTPAMTPDEAVALIRAAVRFAQKENIAFILKARRLDAEFQTMADSLTMVVGILEARAARVKSPTYRSDLAASRQKLLAARDEVPRRRAMVARYLKVLADMEAHWEESEFVLGEMLAALKLARAGDLSPPASAALLAEVMTRLRAMVEALKEFDREVQSRMAGFGEKPKAPVVPAPKPAAPADPGIDEPGEPATEGSKSAAPVVAPLPALDPPLHMLAGVRWFPASNEYQCSDCGERHRTRPGVWKVDLAGIGRVNEGRQQVAEVRARSQPSATTPVNTVTPQPASPSPQPGGWSQPPARPAALVSCGRCPYLHLGGTNRRFARCGNRACQQLHETTASTSVMPSAGGSGGR